jgi:hypothetical protein
MSALFAGTQVAGPQSRTRIWRVTPDCARHDAGAGGIAAGLLRRQLFGRCNCAKPRRRWGVPAWTLVRAALDQLTPRHPESSLRAPKRRE